MLKVAVDRILSLTETRARLSEIVEKAVGEQFWVVTKGGKPKVAVVDVRYLDQLVRRAWFDTLSSRTQETFRHYLIAQGLDPDALSQEEVEAILQS